MQSFDMPSAIARVNAALEHWLPDAGQAPIALHQAMRYAVVDQGKRMRPLLTYATGQVLGIKPARLDGPACAVELIHAYSLVHDDLPAMDDDDLRRGKPSTHKAFGEATAILAADALQALAFQILAGDPGMAAGIPHETAAAARLHAITTLSHASGSQGMVGGQALDMAAEGKTISVEQLEQIHHKKTGQLLKASILMAADDRTLASNDKRQALEIFASHIGLAFQVRDDILDIEGSTETIGKPQGSDHARGKATYPALLGLNEAKNYADSLYQQALDALNVFPDKAEPLRELAAYIIKRDR